MVVPDGPVWTWNSSINRLAPGRPRPRPPLVVKPSSMASSRLAIPGPWSRATTSIPSRPRAQASLTLTSPLPAYRSMLRASSEMAVAIKCWSVGLKPIAAASDRPAWRALTMSASVLMTTATTFSGRSPGKGSAAKTAPRVEQVQPGIEVQCGCHTVQLEAEPRHCEGDLGADPDDHRFGAPEPDRRGQLAQDLGGEGVDDVQESDVHDRRPGAVSPNLIGDLRLEGGQAGVGRGFAEDAEEIVTLLDDPVGHGSGSHARGGAQQGSGLGDRGLEVGQGEDLAQVHAQPCQGLSVDGREAGDDRGGAQEACRLGRHQQVVRNGRVHRRHAGQVDDHDARTLAPDAGKQVAGEVPGAIGVDDPDQGQDQQARPGLEDRGGEFADRLLLAVDDLLPGSQVLVADRADRLVHEGAQRVGGRGKSIEVALATVAQQQHQSRSKAGEDKRPDGEVEAGARIDGAGVPDLVEVAGPVPGEHRRLEDLPGLLLSPAL